MTETSPSQPPQPITHRRVLKIAVPIVLSNVTVPLMGLVDVYAIGQTPEAAPMAAVNLGVIVLSTLYWVFGFLRMGTTGLVGQAAGAGDDAEVSALLSRSLLIAALAGGALILLQYPLFALALAISEASPEAEGMMRQYVAIRIWTAPAAIAVYALTGWLIAMERAGGVFWVQFVMNALNIVLSLWFVLGLGWGVAGAAIATVIAEVAGAALGLWFCRDAFRHAAAFDLSRVLDRVKMRAMMQVNRDILIRSLLLMTIFSSMPFLATPYGDQIVAANAVLTQFLHITAYALDGFAFAAESLVARAYGRKDPARVRRSAVLTSIWGAAICVGLAAVFWFAGGWLIDEISKDPEVQVLARDYLPWMVLAPLTGCAGWMLDGVFIGATRGRDMRNMMALSAGVYWLAILLLVPLLENHALWAALNLSLLARGITMGWRYPALERSARA